MSNWNIQVTDKGEEIKEVKFFPIKDKKTAKLTGFGKMAASCFRVEYFHKAAPTQVWKVCSSKHGFNITCPKRLVPISDNPLEKQMKEVDGRAFNGRATSGSMSLQRLIKELTEQCGQEFAQRVCGLFIMVLTG